MNDLAGDDRAMFWLVRGYDRAGDGDAQLAKAPDMMPNHFLLLVVG